MQQSYESALLQQQLQALGYSPLQAQHFQAQLPMLKAIQGHGAYPQPAPPGKTLQVGDWNCPSPLCGFHNYRSRDVCHKCNTPKPVDTFAGYDAARASAVMRPGDWLCPSPTCQNHNFRARAKCNKCGTPNPNPEQTSNTIARPY